MSISLCINLFLRSLLFYLIIIPTTISWSIICLLCAPLSYTKRYYLTSRWNIFVIFTARIICRIHYQIKGIENLPNAPVILMSKHQSAWETIFYMMIMPKPLAFVLKKELMYVPFFGWSLALLHMISINRKKTHNAFSKIMQQGKKCLARGQWIVIFPEGTRIPIGKTGKYRSGGAHLAIYTNTLIVPIAVNSGQCWPIKSFIKLPGKITISIGQPISPTKKINPIQLTQQVKNWIELEMQIISKNTH